MDMSTIRNLLLEKHPNTDTEKVTALVDLWDEVIHRIMPIPLKQV